MTITTWIDDRIQKAVTAVADAVTAELVTHISDVEQSLQVAIEHQGATIVNELTAQVVNGVEQVINNATVNAEKVIGDVGGAITNTMDHFTIDTAALAQAVAQALKGLLPPIFGSIGKDDQ